MLLKEIAMSSTLFAFADAGDGVLISETCVERFQIVLALAFGVLVVVGSLWIMDHLNANMASPSPLWRCNVNSN